MYVSVKFLLPKVPIFLGEEMLGSLNYMKALIEKLDNVIGKRDNWKPKHTFLNNMILLSIYQKKGHNIRKDSKYFSSGSLLTDEILLKRCERFLRFSIAGYGFGINMILRPPSFKEFSQHFKNIKDITDHNERQLLTISGITHE
eukprot:UN28478